jgi:hypothetical protein
LTGRAEDGSTTTLGGLGGAVEEAALVWWRSRKDVLSVVPFVVAVDETAE